MDDELELIDPEHPDVNEAATATARLLLRIHEQRLSPTAEADSTDATLNGDSQCPSTSPATQI